MIELNSKNNVLMECEYKYSLQDRETGNLYRDMFPYEEVPKCTFNFRLTPANPPDAARSRPGKKAPRRRWPRRRGEHTAAKAP